MTRSSACTYNIFLFQIYNYFKLYLKNIICNDFPAHNQRLSLKQLLTKVLHKRNGIDYFSLCNSS